jgi:Ca2+-transporting ATPase
MEVALLKAAADAGVDTAQLRASLPEIREDAFDEATKMMATVHQHAARLMVAVKGAPEVVLAKCTHELSAAGARALDEATRKRWLSSNDALAARGLRVLALARREGNDAAAASDRDLTLLGLVAFVDPPRREVPEAVARCRAAGIRVVMVTGDQPATAATIATAVGLTDDHEPDVLAGSALDDLDTLDKAGRERLLAAPVFARVSPEQKLNLIAVHQQAGNVVAMTGDGVNDAPALKKADIGIAMGRRGTQVAREAADMVLKDDAFSSIAAAVEQGRVIFRNIRRFVIYLLSCNLSEVLVLGIATLAQAPLPILPLQILFLNLVTDVFPALALGVGAGDPDIMQQPPRPRKQGILEGAHWRQIVTYGVLITATVLAAFAVALARHGHDMTSAVTVSFLTLAFAQLWHVFNLRSPASGLLANDVVRNPWIWGALGLCVALLLAAVYATPLAAILDVAPPDAVDWLVIFTMSLLPLVAGQAWMLLQRSPASSR